MRSAASVSVLTSIKDVTTRDALLIRSIWKCEAHALAPLFPDDLECMTARVEAARRAQRLRQLRRDLIDEVLTTCGVEYLGFDRIANRHVYYCNTGDSYCDTVCFVGDKLVVRSWAYFVESRRVEAEHV